MSILERYEAQVAKKGWGRLVIPEHHNQTYFGMPDTINYIEENGRYDILEIYKRGKVPAEPELIYSVFNSNTQDRTKEVIGDKKFVTKSNHKYGYDTAKESIIKTREENYDEVIPTCEKRFKEIKLNLDNIKKDTTINIGNEEKIKGDKMFLDLMKFYEDVKKKRKLLNSNLHHSDEQEERD